MRHYQILVLLLVLHFTTAAERQWITEKVECEHLVPITTKILQDAGFLDSKQKLKFTILRASLITPEYPLGITILKFDAAVLDEYFVTVHDDTLQLSTFRSMPSNSDEDLAKFIEEVEQKLLTYKLRPNWKCVKLAAVRKARRSHNVTTESSDVNNNSATELTPRSTESENGNLAFGRFNFRLNSAVLETHLGTSLSNPSVHGTEQINPLPFFDSDSFQLHQFWLQEGGKCVGIYINNDRTLFRYLILVNFTTPEKIATVMEFKGALKKTLEDAESEFYEYHINFAYDWKKVSDIKNGSETIFPYEKLGNFAVENCPWLPAGSPVDFWVHIHSLNFRLAAHIYLIGVYQGDGNKQQAFFVAASNTMCLSEFKLHHVSAMTSTLLAVAAHTHYSAWAAERPVKSFSHGLGYYLVDAGNQTWLTMDVRTEIHKTLSAKLSNQQELFSNLDAFFTKIALMPILSTDKLVKPVLYYLFGKLRTGQIYVAVANMKMYYESNTETDQRVVIDFIETGTQHEVELGFFKYMIEKYDQNWQVIADQTTKRKMKHKSQDIEEIPQNDNFNDNIVIYATSHKWTDTDVFIGYRKSLSSEADRIYFTAVPKNVNAKRYEFIEYRVCDKDDVFSVLETAKRKAESITFVISK